MYRRIELISQTPVDEVDRKMAYIKGGICFVPYVNEEIFEAWSDMPAPRKTLRKNCRFFFTEKGWDVYGRKIIKACLKFGQEYRVKRIKENSVEVFYKDEIQVVVRPLRKRP